MKGYKAVLNPEWEDAPFEMVDVLLDGTTIMRGRCKLVNDQPVLVPEIKIVECEIDENEL